MGDRVAGEEVEPERFGGSGQGGSSGPGEEGWSWPGRIEGDGVVSRTFWLGCLSLVRRDGGSHNLFGDWGGGIDQQIMGFASCPLSLFLSQGQVELAVRMYVWVWMEGRGAASFVFVKM